MKNIRQNFSAILVLVTVSLVNGWHLPALQGIAWMNMFNQYNEVMPASKALSFTISGMELCELCEFVKDESNSNQQNLDHWNSAKIQLIISLNNLNEVPVSENDVTENTIYVFNFLKQFASPEAPPPKLLV